MSSERLTVARTGIAISLSAVVLCAASYAQQPVRRLPATDPIEVATYPPQDYQPPTMFNPPPSQLPPWGHAGGEAIGDMQGTFRGDLLGEPVPQRISDIKPGVFQRLSFAGAWMPGGGDDALGNFGPGDLRGVRVAVPDGRSAAFDHALLRGALFGRADNAGSARTIV